MKLKLLAILVLAAVCFFAGQYWTLWAQPEVMTDVALDTYNINGHDGFVENGEIVNDRTVEALVDVGLSRDLATRFSRIASSESR